MTVKLFPLLYVQFKQRIHIFENLTVLKKTLFKFFNGKNGRVGGFVGRGKVDRCEDKFERPTRHLGLPEDFD